MSEDVEGRSVAGARILIIEDEFLAAMDLQGLLQREQAVVLGPAPSIEGALELIEAEQLDAALVDMNLKGRPATEVAAALNARGVPFVLTTGYGTAQLNDVELQGVPRVDKPVDHAELLRLLERLLADAKGQ